MTTRALTASDLARVWQITQGSEFYRPWTELSLSEEIRDAKSLALMEGNQILAFVFFRELAEEIEISWLATDPVEWGRGRMGALLRALFDAYGHRRDVWLEVHESNLPAQKLYEKLGFKRTGKRPRYYHDGASALLYTKVL